MSNLSDFIVLVLLPVAGVATSVWIYRACRRVRERGIEEDDREAGSVPMDHESDLWGDM